MPDGSSSRAGAEIDDYKLLTIATLAMIPLLVVFKAADGGGEHAGVEL